MGSFKLLGKAVNRGGGYGMEIPCVYQFTGQPRNVDMLNKLLDNSNNRSVRKEQESLEMLQSEVFQIFCVIYSFILFIEHCNLLDAMLITNTFA